MIARQAFEDSILNRGTIPGYEGFVFGDIPASADTIVRFTEATAKNPDPEKRSGHERLIIRIATNEERMARIEHLETEMEKHIEGMNGAKVVFKWQNGYVELGYSGYNGCTKDDLIKALVHFGNKINRELAKDMPLRQDKDRIAKRT